ncbi:unnamed protein product, partial [Oppiella nova]
MSGEYKDELRANLLNDLQLKDVTNYSHYSLSKKVWKVFLGAGIIVIVIGVGIGFGLYYGLKEPDGSKNSTMPTMPPSTTMPPECDGSCLGSYTSDSYLGVYNKYAISTDSEPCAPIGKAILEKGGNAIDSMISVLLCMGVTIPESMGLGGGALILIYNGSHLL